MLISSEYTSNWVQREIEVTKQSQIFVYTSGIYIRQSLQTKSKLTKTKNDKPHKWKNTKHIVKESADGTFLDLLSL